VRGGGFLHAFASFAGASQGSEAVREGRAEPVAGLLQASAPTALLQAHELFRDCPSAESPGAGGENNYFQSEEPVAQKSDASLVARRICELLEKEPQEPLLSVSVRIASYPENADTIGTLLYAAGAVCDEKQTCGHACRFRLLSALTNSNPQP
jgi:hypothetical protein